jgi:hypothetical protein
MRKVLRIESRVLLVIGIQAAFVFAGKEVIAHPKIQPPFSVLPPYR